MVEQVIHVVVFDRDVEHRIRAVGKNGQRDTHCLESFQRCQVFREGAQTGVLVHQVLAAKIGQFELQAAAPKNQRIPGNVPEGAELLAHAANTRVFDLLLPPEGSQLVALAREILFGERIHAIDIEQRRVGVEGDGFDWRDGGFSHDRFEVYCYFEDKISPKLGDNYFT